VIDLSNDGETFGQVSHSPSDASEVGETPEPLAPPSGRLSNGRRRGECLAKVFGCARNGA